VLLQRRVPHTVAGIAGLCRLLTATHGLTRVAIERAEGLLVERLLTLDDVEVFWVSPKISSRARERYRLAATKTDEFDAFVLADTLRHEHGFWRSLRPASDTLMQLRAIIGDRERGSGTNATSRISCSHLSAPRLTAGVCIVHLMRNSFRYSARQDWDAISRGLRPVYQAATVDEAEERFLEFQEAWGAKYPAIVGLWSNSWAEFVPFLQFDREIRRIVCTTNAIWVFDLTCRGCLASRPDRLPLALNAIDDSVLDSKCRLSRPKVSGPGCLA